MKLYPSLLTSSLAEFEKQLAVARANDELEVVQIDVIDGYFADNLTLTPLDLTQQDFGELKIDFHLMTEEPLDFVNELIAVKKYLPVRAVIAQLERMSSQAEYLKQVKSHDWLAGLSLDLFTPLDSIDLKAWPELDIVQLMTIEAGFQGQKFQDRALDKIEPLRQRARQILEIILDGGVKKKEVKLAQELGVDGVAVGSGLWQVQDPVAAMTEYLAVMKETDEN